MSHILTLVASNQSPELTEEHFDTVISHCTRHGVQIADKQLLWLEKGKAGQIHVTDDAPMDLVRQLRESLAGDKIDFFIVDKGFKPKLFVADMESTIIPNEILDDLAKIYGIEDKVKNITERGMRGEITFADSLRERIALLTGITEKDLREKRNSLEPNPGAQEFVQTLNDNGVTCVLATGGFTYFSERIAKLCNFDDHHANVLDIENGKLTGKVINPILDSHAKVFFMDQYVDDLGIKHNQCITIGDGANDLPMLEKAGLGIGYHPKPAVEEVIRNCIFYGDFNTVGYALSHNTMKSVNLENSTTQQKSEPKSMILG
ncbi:MAG: phosphoserine phosphatase SerB [Alphaproteobacteria bacterium]|nr:phosphoserine phosphatase SerB [Alphaproteobacteria bacterium]